MDVIKEIGWVKFAKFIIYSFLQPIYNFLLLPPLRIFFLLLLGAKVGAGSIILNARFFNWHHKGPGGLSIGKECFLGDEVLIDLYDEVVLGNSVTLAPRVTILTHLNVGFKNHPLQKYFSKKSSPVVIKNGSVVAAASIVLPGVTINENSFVAAGSVVNQDVPPRTLVAGVPAKIIRKIE